jgi:hypothetical protein
MPVGPATTNNISPLKQHLTQFPDWPRNCIPFAQDHDRFTRNPSPKPLPVEIRRAPGSGLENTPGLEDDHVDTGQFWSTD